MDKKIVGIIVLVLILISWTIFYLNKININNSSQPNTVNYYAQVSNFLMSKNLVSVYPSNANLTQLLMTPRIGIVTAMAMEQAPLLAQTKVNAVVNISGYTFYLGVMKGHNVVLVRSGEKEYASTMATTLMDTYFNIQAALLSGTAGSRNPNVVVGDVVLGAYAVDKSSIHYHLSHLGNESYSYSETPYTGVEIVNVTAINNSVVGGFGEAQDTPSNASNYGCGFGVDYSYTYVEALPSSLGLLKLAESYPYPMTIPDSQATGMNVTGNIRNEIIAGVIGSANQWTEPLFWMAQQNALYQTDAGENEGMGFAYVNTHFQIPWLIVRGISDSPWYPSVYEGVLAADRAANVTMWVVSHFNSSVKGLHDTASFYSLSPQSNARIHGYIVADKVYYTDFNVTLISYTAPNGTTINDTDPDCIQEYSYPKE
ncbi:5'-methylthioadenosine/S-adenosylhomocysteine nucleosidase family protein [Sulfuracidifex tepidarius]|nr:5'-methylthioadenosine/S-adenosylhomocysteine nucleosidase [Sulfuracidifex tepidarius]